MKLINQSPLASELAMSVHEETRRKTGTVFAKATFRWDDRGWVHLDDQQPVPLFAEDVPTPLGLLPADLYAREDPAFEVMLLGMARPAGHQRVARMSVELTVGEVTRELSVTGDRRWEKSMLGLRRTMSEPEPFRELPLTWDRAFGGMSPVYFDRTTILDVEDVLNRYGRGFDAEKRARDMAVELKAPEGFPVLRYERLVPNLEHPRWPVREWDDAPEPCCWAPVPRDIGMKMIRTIRYTQAHQCPPPPEATYFEALHRAHPDWIIDIPPRGASIVMDGLSRAGRVSLALPDLKVLVDYVLGERRGTRELVPKALLLMPEQRLFTLTWQRSFHMEVTPKMERSFRLRLEDGWHERGAPADVTAHGARGATA